MKIVTSQVATNAGGAWIRITCTSTNRILVGKRTDGLWNYFGGGVDKGETALEGAVRELFEETGIKVKPADLKKTGKVKSKTLKQRKLTLYDLEVEEEIKPPKLDDKEHSKYKWVKKKKFKKMDVNKPTKILRHM